MSKTFKTPHGKIYYDVIGKGEPLLLHQGLGRSSKYWLGFDQELASHFKVIIFDTRGLGRSSHSKHPLDLHILDFAEDMMALLTELNLNTRPVHLLGVSLGGMAITAFASKYPQACKSLTIINSSIGGTLTPRISPLGLLSLVIAGTLPRFSSNILAYSLLGRSLAHKERQNLIDRWKKLQQPEWPQLKAVASHLLAALRFSKNLPLHTINVPALILFGSEDILVPMKNSENIYKLLPQAQIKEIIGGGHEMYLEKPNEIVREILNFMSMTA